MTTRKHWSQLSAKFKYARLRLQKCYRSVTFLFWQFVEQSKGGSLLELHPCYTQDLTKFGGTRFYMESKVFVHEWFVDDQEDKDEKTMHNGQGSVQVINTLVELLH